MLVLSTIKYRIAMNNALVKNDYTDIYDFYHYKICDSIIALDVKYNDIKHNKNYIDEEKNNVKGSK